MLLRLAWMSDAESVESRCIALPVNGAESDDSLCLSRHCCSTSALTSISNAAFHSRSALNALAAASFSNSLLVTSLFFSSRSASASASRASAAPARASTDEDKLN
jgi:hypothetical protein